MEAKSTSLFNLVQVVVRVSGKVGYCFGRIFPVKLQSLFLNLACSEKNTSSYSAFLARITLYMASNGGSPIIDEVEGPPCAFRSNSALLPVVQGFGSSVTPQ